jgi:hypothetical protein
MKNFEVSRIHEVHHIQLILKRKKCMRLDQSFRECKQNEDRITTKNSKASNSA